MTGDNFILQLQNCHISKNSERFTFEYKAIKCIIEKVKQSSGQI